MEEFSVRIEVEEFNLFPKIGKYKSMVDDLSNFNYSFEGGKVYGLIGECGSGGWGISYLLCGRDSAEGCRVFINGVQVSQKELKRTGWYVGEGIEKKYFFSKEKNVIKQIRHGLKKSKKCDENEIVKRFGLSDRRLNLKLSNLSGERCRASAAIGYAHDCKIFCLPWINTSNMNDLITSSRVDVFADILKKEGNVVIIPTEKIEVLEMIADEIIVIDNPRHMPSPQARKIMIDYHISGND